MVEREEIGMSTVRPSVWTEQVVETLIVELVTAEWAKLRPTEPPLLSREGGGSAVAKLALGSDGLGADSLELLQLASTVADFFQMREVGIEDYLLVRRSVPAWVGLVCQSLSIHGETLGFRTSGSTGKPKLCVHKLDDLVAEARFWAGLFQPRSSVVGVVPRHHIYGFIFSILLPLALDVPYVDGRHRTPSGVGRALSPGALVVGFPDFWSLVSTSKAASVFWPDDVHGVTSTGPCPSDVARAVVPKPVSSLTQVYGSSETAGVGWRRGPDDPYELLPDWRRKGGNILLRGDGEAGIKLQDALVWTDARRFCVGARDDAAVQVGGINVFQHVWRPCCHRTPRSRMPGFA